MQLEIALKVQTDKEGCDPAVTASLGELAKMISGELSNEKMRGMYCEPCGKYHCGSCEKKSGLGAVAKEYSAKGIKKSAIDIFDLRKEDESNVYEDPEKTGNRTK